MGIRFRSTLLANFRYKFNKQTLPKYKYQIKNSLFYYDIFAGRFKPIELQKFCFFYKPEVPDFGKDFHYLKLGKKENIFNPLNYNVIFEADLPVNLSQYNEFLLDYSGIYALIQNNLIKKKYILIIHYDTLILHQRWLEIIMSKLKKNNVIFSTWPIGGVGNDIGKWIYSRIDDVFLASHQKPFSSYIKKYKINRLPNTSQFACCQETFDALGRFLLPIYNYILKQNDISFLYAHLLERAWGLFFAIETYKTVPVIKDSHNQANNYLKKCCEQTNKNE